MENSSYKKDTPEKTRVSVIIPTYNRLWALPLAVESVMGQTFTDFELIIVDDGSTDGTGEWIRENLPDAIYIYQENGGVGGARNRGIEAASGEYIAFLDSDDRWLPEKLERQVKVMDGGEDVSYTDEIWIRNEKRVNPKLKHRKYSGDIFLESLTLVIISPSSVMIARDVLSDVGPFDETLLACEDYDLWIRLTSRYTVSYIDEPLIVKTGGHEDQLSRKYWGLDMLRIYALEKLLESEHLNEPRVKAVMAEIIKKAEIVRQGAKKRGNESGTRYYKEKVRIYEKRLNAGTDFGLKARSDASRT